MLNRNAQNPERALQMQSILGLLSVRWQAITNKFGHYSFLNKANDDMQIHRRKVRGQTDIFQLSASH